MTTIEIGDLRDGRPFGRVVREWWPVPAILAFAADEQDAVLVLHPDARGRR